jgi:hypothetical protein
MYVCMYVCNIAIINKQYHYFSIIFLLVRKDFANFVMKITMITMKVKRQIKVVRIAILWLGYGSFKEN